MNGCDVSGRRETTIKVWADGKFVLSATRFPAAGQPNSANFASKNHTLTLIRDLMATLLEEFAKPVIRSKMQHGIEGDSTYLV